MAERLLDRQISLLDYLTSGAAIFGDKRRAALVGLLRLEARFSYEKRMEKIVAVFPNTFELLGADQAAIVREFVRTCPPMDIGHLINARIIRKLPGSGRLPDGYGCVAIEDVNDVATLSARLAAILEDPAPAAAVGARGRKFALEMQRDAGFPQAVERVLAAAAARKPITRATQGPPDDEQHIDDASTAAIKVAIAAAEKEADKSGPRKDCDPLFRLRMGRWAMDRDDLAGLVPLRDGRLRVIEIDYDVSEFTGGQIAAAPPAAPTAGRSHVVVFGRSGAARRSPLIIDAMTARILDLSDGTRTVSDILRALDRKPGLPSGRDVEWIEHIFVQGLVSLQAKPTDRTIRARRKGAAARRTCARNSGGR
jgi:hypothetical protein